ncbi:MAG: type II secretion system F family protein [Planctomycetota bacterium]
MKSRRVVLSAQDRVHFTRQLSLLMEAGVPLVEGLHAIAEQEPRAGLQALYQDVTARISSGDSVGAALEAHRASFGGVYVDTVRAAESVGSLGTVLESLAEMLERDDELFRSVRAAFLYPACVSVVLVLAVTFLVGFVLPKFGAMFAARDMDLPAITRILLGASEVVRGYWPGFLGACAVAIWGVVALRRHEAARLRLDALLVRVPVLSMILKGLALARFARVLGVGIRAGAGLITALESAGQAAGRPLLRREVDIVQSTVHSGGRLADGLSDCRYIPAFAKRLIAIGEEAGELPKMLDVIARHYERDVQRLTKTFAALLEPILILVVTGAVLAVAFAIFLPMWSMADLIGG